MCNKHFFVLLLLLPSISAIGQPHFSGLLIDQKSEKPIPYAYLYINGTTKSTISDSTGFFKFMISDYPTEIEISHLNYEPTTILLIHLPLTDTTIPLNPRDFYLDDITVTSKRVKKEYVRTFKKEFLGEDKWGIKAQLINEECLVFYINDSTFQARASEPLIVNLPKLGYEVRVELSEFVIERNQYFNRNTTAFLAKYLFQSYNQTDSDLKKNRELAYFNSAQHFLRSLFHNKLDQNGYRVFLGIKDSLTSQMTYMPVHLSDSMVHVNEDIKYLDQENQEYHIFYYNDKKGRPLDLTKNKPHSSFVLSSVYFKKNRLQISKDGTVTDTSMIFGGFIGSKRVGATLPGDYLPPNDYGID